jgi:dCMP deaminase
MNWDRYFYEMCKTVAKNSKCFSRKIGTVLVRDKSIISTGYNGPPRGIPHCGIRHHFDQAIRKEFLDKGVLSYKDFEIFNAQGGKENTEIIYNYQTKDFGQCPRRLLKFKSGEGLEWCVAGHAERNSLINAARNGIKTKGTTMYMSCGIPCTPCLVEIINSGVVEIVVTKMSFYDISAEYILKNSNLKYRLFDCETD